MFRVWGLTFLAVLWLPLMAYAAPDLSVNSVIGAPGSTVSVTVKADFSVAVNSLQFNLQFDQNLLTVSSVSTAGLPTSTWTTVNNPNTPGTVVVGMYNTGGSAFAVTGSGQQIVVINFTVNNPPGDAEYSCALGLSDVYFDTANVTQLTAGTYTSTLAPTMYTLTVNESGTGNVTEAATVNGEPSTQTNFTSASFPSGTVVQLTPVPGSNFQFSDWTQGASGSADPLNVTMSGNITILANFSSSGIAPSITTQPVSVTVTAPAPATFTAAASGTPAPIYQWADSTNGGLNWTNISGATSASYTTPATSVANSGTEYELMATNASGVATSNRVTLTVDATPAITVQPINQTAIAPATATFTVSATGAPAPGYQWQQSTNGGATWTNISGATNASYTTAATAIANSGTEYKCVVTNVAGTATSNAATLTVYTTPAITSQPGSQTVNAPAPATFTVVANGTPTPSYQWQQSTNGGSTWTTISGATGSSYTTAATSVSNSGTEYDCVVTNSAGSVTSNAATLTVNPTPAEPSFTTQPVSATVIAPAAATFTVAATGTPAPSYQWESSNNGGSTWTPISGATGTSYTTPATAVPESGIEFECVATNTAGTVSSNGAVLTVNPQPVVPSITTQPVSVTITAPAAAAFSAAGTGTPAPTYQWKVSTNGGVSWTNISGATATLYTISTTTTSESGTEYELVATNTAGTATSNAATLTVNAIPAITAQPNSQTVTAPATATFTVAATGTPAPGYQWQQSTNGGSTWTNISGATSASYVTPATTASNNGTEYKCVVTNTAGTATSNAATLTVNVIPAITSQPVSQAVTAPATATFTVTATGTPAPSYQWEESTNGGFSFTNISGATSASYTTPATAVSQSGTEFECVVTNTAGTATSNAAVLTVSPAPVVPSITTQPASVSVTAPATATFTVTATGTPTPSYQWKESVNGGVNFLNISGAISASYTTSATAVSNNGTEYECVVTNTAGTTTSNAAILTVNAAPVVPSITPQPVSVTVTAPAAATFSAAASGTPAPSYQWKESTNNGATWINISGATGTSYTTPATAVSNNGTEYEFVATNTAGTATSNAAILAVNSSGGQPTPTVWWKLNDGSGSVASDYSGDGYNATLYNNPTWTTGITGGALSFNGVNNYLAQPSIDFSATQAVTVAFWLNESSYSTNSVIMESTVNYNSSATGFGFFQSDTGTCGTNKLEIAIHGNAGYNVECYVPPSAGAWHHYAAVYNKANPAGSEISLYIDGVLQSALSHPYAAANTNYFGVNSLQMMEVGQSSFLSGILDDVRLYNTALTAPEVTAIYQSIPTAAPSITTQPVSQSVTAPSTATFTIAATGTPTPTYQWEESVNSGATWTNISGATSASYTTPATTTSESGTEFKCAVTNIVGSATSNAATLTVATASVAPSIIAQPASASVTAPATATFTVAASGTPIPTYQWEESTNSGATWTNISGATNASYTTPATAVSQSGAEFECIVSNTAGSATSNAATLTVAAASVAPSITAQPASVSVTAPATAIFTIAASGTPTPTYQWEESTNGGSTWTNISGATSASYTTPATAVSQSGAEFECIVSNTAGSATSNAAILTVNSSGGQPSPTVWWKLNDGSGSVASDSSGNGYNATLYNNPTWTTGITGGALSFNGVNNYLAQPSIDFSATQAVTVAFWLNESSYSTNSVIMESTVNYNSSATGFGFFQSDTGTCGTNKLEIAIHGNAGYNVECYVPPSAGAWHHYAAVYNKANPAGSEISLYIDGVLQSALSHPYAADNNNYFGANSLQMMEVGQSSFLSGILDDVRLYNTALTAPEVATIYQSIPTVAPSITTQPVSQSVTAPSTATFTIAATGTPTPTYQWEISTNGGASFTAISGASSASYTTPATTTAQSGTEFKCVVTNTAGSATSNAATLTVATASVAPSITTQPVSQSVTAPATATFSVAASGTPTPTYQWEESTTSGATWINISGATSAIYTTPATAVSQSGTEFECIVSNTAGSATSNAGTLTVTAGSVAPSITTQPASVSVTAPATATFSVAASGTPTPSYQWMVSTNGGGTWAAINGATSASYTTGATAVQNSGTEFECVVTNTAGTATSNAATLTVYSQGSQPSPTVWWKLNDGSGSVASDSSGNGYNATLYNNPTWTTGMTGGALSFNGVNNYLAQPAINLSTTQAVTVTFWLNENSYSANSVIMESTTNYNSSATGFGVFQSDPYTCGTNKLEMAIHGNTGYNIECYAPPSTGVWHHFAVEYNKASATGSEISLYIDGVLQNAINQPYAADNTNYFGNNSLQMMEVGLSSFLSGTLDDVRIYNTALTSAEITTIYQDIPPVVPSITTQPVNVTVTAPITATFTVTATGTPAPSYQWEISTNGGTSFTAISGATSASYTTAATAVSNNGTEYKCVVTNSAGSATSNAATLTVNAPGALPNPTVWWKLNDGSGSVASDSSGNGYNATLYNNPTWTTGMTGGALSFNGVNNYLAQPAINLSTTQAVTVAFWLNENSYSTNGVIMESTTNYNSSATGFGVFQSDPDTCGTNKLEIAIHGNTGYNIECYAPPSAATWHHFVAVYNKANPAGSEITLYIDGVLQNAINQPYAANNNNYFGNNSLQMMEVGLSSYLSGTLDDVRIYNTAFTSTEVSALYVSEL